MSGQSARAALLDALADGTSGRSLHENELAKGRCNLVAVPEVSYLIAFTPHHLKYDGKFHSLKVEGESSHKTARDNRGASWFL